MYYGRTKGQDHQDTPGNEGKFTLLKIKINYKATGIKTAWFW